MERRPLADLFVAALSGIAVLGLSLLTLLAATMDGWLVAGAVLLSYAASIGAFLWRARRRPASRSRWEALRRFMNVAFVVSALALGTAIAANFPAMARPPQAKLAARFQQQRGEYAQLRDMVLADDLATVAECGRSFARKSFLYVPPEQLGISAERVATYRQLLRAVDCPRVGVGADRSVTFSLASWGAANRGWRIHLLWSTGKPSPLVPSIDGFRKAKGRYQWESAHSPIEGDWYLGILW